MDFKRLEEKPVVRLSVVKTAEERYWERYQSVLREKVAFGNISSVDISPKEPNNYVITAGTKIVIYNSTSNIPVKEFTKFRDVMHSGTFREDGRLIVSGSEDSRVYVLEPERRLVLSELEGHTAPVHVAQPDKLNLTNLVSGGDDRTLKSWDLSTSACVHSFEGHTDHIRCLDQNCSAGNVWLSGSFDHTVLMWDFRAKNVISKFQHEKHVEDLLVLPGGSLMAVAVENAVHIWDLLASKEIARLVNHHKVVTSLEYDDTLKRLLFGSLDKMVKCCDLTDFKITSTLSFENPILDIAVTRNHSSHLIVAMTNGYVDVKQKRKISAANGTSSAPGRSFFDIFDEEIQPNPKEELGQKLVIAGPHKGKELKLVDKDLKKFNYKDALDHSLAKESTSPPLVTALLRELMNRDNGLKKALAGRSDDEFIPLLRFLSRNIAKTSLSDILIPTALTVLEIYGDKLCESENTRIELERLTSKLNAEISVLEALLPVMGTLDMIRNNTIL